MATWQAIAAMALGLALMPLEANAQGTYSVPANVASLGAIPDGIGAACGAYRSVTFSVSAGQAVTLTSVAVSMTASHSYVGDLHAELIDPFGRSFVIFQRTGTNIRPSGSTGQLEGTYRFSDDAGGNWWGAAVAADPSASTLPPGDYRTSAPGTGAVTVMNPLFAGQRASGEWTLRFRDCDAGAVGRVTAATLILTGVPIATVYATQGTLGAIPDGPSTTPQTPGAPLDVTFPSPPGRGPVRSVRVYAVLAHPSMGDLVARLIAPNGSSHILFGYTGATTTGGGANGRGATTVLTGESYSFDDAAIEPWWITAAFNTVMPFGRYFPSQLGGPGSTGARTQMNPVFAGGPSAGAWTLRLTDGRSGAAGSIVAATLVIETLPTPTTIADGFSTAYLTPLAVTAPGVLLNDADNLGGAMSAELVGGPAHGVLTLSATGAFTYTPAAGFVGTDSFIYRASTSSGPGNPATVTIAVVEPTAVQPPTDFRVSSLVANQLTVRWKPATAGAVATGYVVEGGVTPGQVLGAIPGVGALPIVTFQAPTGAFHLRVHAIANGQRSGPSNEIQVFVNTATPPSAPASLVGVVNGGTLGLAWRNTFNGGATSSLVIDVTGSAVAALSMPLSETFSFAGVPGGTYSFRVRSANAAGTSFGSNPVTLTFPNGCSGAPSPPVDFLAYAIGNVVHLVWDPPPGGFAATSYVVNVSGSFTGSLPFAVRSFRTPAPSGAYSFTVAALNACGSSAATAPQTVFVP